MTVLEDYMTQTTHIVPKMTSQLVSDSVIEAGASLYDIFFKATASTDLSHIFVGVKTTGIFCRQGCPARTPKAENCTFYNSAKAALKAGYRACKRCHPLNLPDEASHLIKTLIALIESDLEHRWSETDLKNRSIDPSTARRQFKRRFGMTFTQYARARRLGAASKNLNKGESVISAQLSAGYNSASGFRQAFAQRFGQSPNDLDKTPLSIEWIDTPLGPMIAICDDKALYLLEFTIRKNLDRQLTRLQKTYKRAITPGRTEITDHIETELKAYFAGQLQKFETPLIMSGTAFQKTVWKALLTIPFGAQWSYSDLAQKVGNEKAVRAVASSNGSNGLALIIPCHRVIAKGGGLGGYAGGVENKAWLLEHEKRSRETP